MYVSLCLGRFIYSWHIWVNCRNRIISVNWVFLEWINLFQRIEVQWAWPRKERVAGILPCLIICLDEPPLGRKKEPPQWKWKEWVDSNKPHATCWLFCCQMFHGNFCSFSVFRALNSWMSLLKWNQNHFLRKTFFRPTDECWAYFQAGGSRLFRHNPAGLNGFDRIVPTLPS